MLQFAYEILPVVLFFLTFKWYGIYAATVAGIFWTFLQVLFSRFFFGEWDKKQCIVLLIFAFFGGLTLYFHDPIFVKWKPSIVFWLFALVLWVSRWFAKKPILASMMGAASPELSLLPAFVWRRMEYGWMMVLLGIGFLNVWIAYQYSDAVWVNFKFYGITSLLIIVSVLQAVYLSFELERRKPHDG